MDEIKRYKIDNTKEPDSRYNLLDRVVYDNGLEIIETPNPMRIPKSPKDRFHEVKVHELGRLDLISYNYYGTPLYWWCIAVASGINDPLSIEPGTRLRIPPLSSLASLKGVIR